MSGVELEPELLEPEEELLGELLELLPFMSELSLFFLCFLCFFVVLWSVLLWSVLFWPAGWLELPVWGSVLAGELSVPVWLDGVEVLD